MTQKQVYRLAKFVAHSGYCSRRDAEKLIIKGLILVNGVVVTNCATMVTASDEVMVHGRKINIIKYPRLWLCNKPKGCITTHNDPQGRTTLFSLLPTDMPYVISVGRLDYNTEGLILLTDSPKLARYLEHPSSEITRQYKCRIFGALSDDHLRQLKNGVCVDGIQYGCIHGEFIKTQGAYTWVMLSLKEGKNREIRKIIKYFGFEVCRLIRVQYDKFHLNMLVKNFTMELGIESVNEYMRLI